MREYACQVSLPTEPELPTLLSGTPLDHVAIATDDLDAATSSYRLLGLEQVGADETVPTQGVTVRMLKGGPVLIELLTPTHENSPVARFLAKRGPGLHHIALEVNDLGAELERLSQAGAPLLDLEPKQGRGGSLVAFIHPRFAAGVLIELVEHR